jgi:hypothetical protein
VIRVLDLLFHPSLVARPDLVLGVAGCFAAVAVLALLTRLHRSPVRLRAWPCFAAAALWVLLAWWEAGLVGKGYNIRVDLILLHPLLTLLSAMALIAVAWPLSRNVRPAGDDAVTPGAGTPVS